ncbi:hypothetical protein F4775DRAFT_596766 [Biscogniauxia sp. FL1348]|nr:hypothetical protein F4775DRAFT_596766 [Biscogniauxia sp. FL1348]
MADFGATIAATTAASAALAGASSDAQASRWRAYTSNSQPSGGEQRSGARTYRGARYSSYSYGYGHPMYHHPTYHVHRPGCPQCYYRDFLADSIEKYNASRAELRETYIWNLRELSRLHSSSFSEPASPSSSSPPQQQQQQQQQRRRSPSPQQQVQSPSSLPAPGSHDIQSPSEKTPEQKEAELDKLYRYYVWRVREVYDNHREHHQRLFGRNYLYWVKPERIYLGPNGDIIGGDRGTRGMSVSISGSGSGSGSGAEPSRSGPASGEGSRSNSWPNGGEGGYGAYRSEEWGRRYSQQPEPQLGYEHQCSATEGLGGNEGESEGQATPKG